MAHNCVAAPLTIACFGQRQEHIWLQGQVRPPQLFQGCNTACGHSHTPQALLHQPLQDSSGAPHPTWLKAPPQTSRAPSSCEHVCCSCVPPPTHSPLPPCATGPSPHLCMPFCRSFQPLSSCWRVHHCIISADKSLMLHS